jgi:hypothetical protein
VFFFTLCVVPLNILFAFDIVFAIIQKLQTILSSQEAFEKEEFSGRPGNFSGTFFQKGKTGITTTEGRKHFYAPEAHIMYLAVVS